MIEVNNRFYTQRFFAKKLRLSDLFRAVTYTQYEGGSRIPFWYKKIWGESSTLDLSQSEEQLFKAMKSNTRNEIKRAIKEGCTFGYDKDYNSFIPFFNEFAKSKGLKERTDYNQLSKYDETIITRAEFNGIILAMHAIVVNRENKEAMLLLSCSKRLDNDLDRRVIGWANRYLHYQEFQLCKEWNIERFEWNGICTNPERAEVYNISQFKLSFGSDPKKQLNLRTPLFVLFKIVYKYLGIIKKNLSR